MNDKAMKFGTSRWWTAAQIRKMDTATLFRELAAASRDLQCAKDEYPFTYGYSKFRKRCEGEVSRFYAEIAARAEAQAETD